VTLDADTLEVIVDVNGFGLCDELVALRSEVEVLRDTVRCLIRGQDALASIADAVDVEVCSARNTLEVSVRGEASNGYDRAGGSGHPVVQRGCVTERD
jgi:hypothetical protein